MLGKGGRNCGEKRREGGSMMKIRREYDREEDRKCDEKEKEGVP